MSQIKFRVRYVGEDASDNRLPAHEGATSMEGMTWAISLIGNYAATGTIRKRGALDDRFRLYILPSRPGSFVSEMVAVLSEPQNMFITSVVGAYAVATMTDAINGLIKYSFKRVVGASADDKSPEYKKLQKLPSGDLEAIQDGIEPSLARAHGIVGSGASSFTLQRARTPMIQFNAGTKAYVNTNNVAPIEEIMTVSVGALNVNTGNGRMYLPDVGKTVPFAVIKEPVSGTYEALSASLNRYARGLPSDVDVVARQVLGVDGRIKKLIISAAGADLDGVFS